MCLTSNRMSKFPLGSLTIYLSCNQGCVISGVLSTMHKEVNSTTVARWQIFSKQLDDTANSPHRKCHLQFQPGRKDFSVYLINYHSVWWGLFYTAYSFNIIMCWIRCLCNMWLNKALVVLQCSPIKNKLQLKLCSTDPGSVQCEQGPVQYAASDPPRTDIHHAPQRLVKKMYTGAPRKAPGLFVTPAPFRGWNGSLLGGRH